jgi:hypothetical protein
LANFTKGVKLEIVVSRDDLVEWLNGWIETQDKDGNHIQATELEFVRDTLLDDGWALLKEYKTWN